MTAEEILWAQKARADWILEGEKNTKFFHASVADKRAHSKIHSIKDDAGNCVTDPIQIAAIGHFQKQFHSAQDLVVNSQFEGIIPHLVSYLQNQDLVKIPDMEEVKNIVFDMKESISTDPDGFNGKFSHFFFYIIANDLICMLLFLLSFQVLLYLSLGLVIFFLLLPRLRTLPLSTR